MSKLKVTINTNRCVGSRLCVGFLPDVFEMNAEGQSTIVQLGDTSALELVQTAEQCPQCAIRVEDEETGEVLFPPSELEM
ncbi:MAG: ferredoxin [Chitinophagales bacterium]